MSRRRRKFAADNPKKYWRHVPHTPTPRFIDLCEVNWDNLEEWWHNSLPKQRIRIPACERYPDRGEPLKFIDTARHHTTRGRSKLERMMDRYWFVPIDDKVQYGELAYSKAIPPRHTTIYPPFLPKGRPKPKPKAEMTCGRCGGPFLAKRKDAKFCSAKCQKAAKRLSEIIRKKPHI
jgi:hypothetical protein